MTALPVVQSKRSTTYGTATCHGFSLVEVVAVMGLSAILSGIVVAAMAAILRVDRSVNRHTAERSELQRFSSAIRDDLHQASGVRWNAAVLNLEIKEKNIRYEVVEGRWMRITGQSGDSTIRTGYGLSDSFECHCEPEVALQGERVRVRLRSTSGDHDDQRRRRLECEIVATVGRDYDLLSE